MDEARLFKTEDLGDVIVVRPVRNMGEYEIADSVTPAFDTLVAMTTDRNVVLDLSGTDYFGSSTIGLFLQFVKHVHAQERKIAFCRLSSHEQEIAGITHINQLLNVKDSLAEAIDFVATHKTKKDLDQ